MNRWIFLTPLITAAAGWFFVSLVIRRIFRPLHPVKFWGLNLQGVVPGRWKEFAAMMGRMAAVLLPVKEIAEKITHPDNVKKIMPQAEAHIDEFLRVKLVKSMPVVGMFVGDKTINTLKSLFVQELEQLFPEIMKSYLGRLEEDFDIEKMITARIAATDPAQIEKAALKMMKKEIRMAKLTGAAIGLVAGLLEWGMILILTKTAIVS